MYKNFHRSNRISEEIKKEISLIIQKFIDDPRINRFSTISDVILSKDYSYAKVFISYPEKKKFIKIFSLRFLNNASGYIRFLLSKKLNLRIIPKIKFFYDFSFINGKKISNLLRMLKK
ncbi:30S ribosome-binding factor [Buchnera aphidicola (Chaetosiphella stipae setosa)]